MQPAALCVARMNAVLDIFGLLDWTRTMVCLFCLTVVCFEIVRVFLVGVKAVIQLIHKKLVEIVNK